MCIYINKIHLIVINFTFLCLLPDLLSFKTVKTHIYNKLADLDHQIRLKCDIMTPYTKKMRLNHVFDHIFFLTFIFIQPPLFFYFSILDTITCKIFENFDFSMIKLKIFWNIKLESYSSPPPLPPKQCWLYLVCYW